MDWSPLTRRRGLLYVVVGFALLATPLVVGHYDLADPDRYRYEAAEVTFHGNGTYDVPIDVQNIDSDVACLNFPSRRSCMLERAIHAEGGVYYEDGVSRHFLRAEYDYVFVYGDGFYGPVTEDLPNETVRYDLEPVSTAEALDRVSTPLEHAPPGVRTTVRTGRFETRDELAGANELVRTADGLYVVYPAAYRVESGERSPGVVALQWALVALGAALVLRGQRHRVRGSQ